MTSLDILYYTLATGFIVLVIFISYATFQLAKTLKTVQHVVENIDDVTTDVSRLKNVLKIGFFGTLANIIAKIIERR